jgi:DNA-binding MarR family transcriptional regulator
VTPPLPDSDAVGEGARARLDDVIHSPVRLSVVAALAATDEAEFAAVRDAVQISDSALSKAVTVLEEAGYVQARKGYVGKRPRTWLRLTPAGRDALRAHLAALRSIAGD